MGMWVGRRLLGRGRRGGVGGEEGGGRGGGFFLVRFRRMGFALVFRGSLAWVVVVIGCLGALVAEWKGYEGCGRRLMGVRPFFM